MKLQIHPWEHKRIKAKRRSETRSSCTLTVPIGGSAPERWHEEQHYAPIGSHGLLQARMGSHSCRYLYYFSLSHALSTYFPQPHVQTLCPSPAVVFLLLQSAVSLLCETPDLWPQFSVKLEFEILLISSDLCLTPLILPPLSYCVSVPSLLPELFPKSIFFPLFVCISYHLHFFCVWFSWHTHIHAIPNVFIRHAYRKVHLFVLFLGNKQMNCEVKPLPFFAEQPPPIVLPLSLSSYFNSQKFYFNKSY